MKRLRFPVLVCALALSACGFAAPAAKRTPPPPTPPPPVSTIAATLRVPGADIVAMLNDSAKSKLVRLDGGEIDCLGSTCRLDLLVVRDGPITGHATGSGMQLTVPFRLRGHLSLRSRLFGTGGDASARGEATALTQFSLRPDWRIESHTQGDVRLSDAKLRIGPLRMNVAKLWNRNRDTLSRPIFKSIDKRIAKAIGLRRKAEHLWRKIQQPIRIGRKPGVWLVISPERLRIAPLQTQNGALVVSLAANVRARVTLGDRPQTAKPAPLPAPKKLAAPSDAFSVSVPVTLSYKEAARLALRQLKWKPIRAGTGEVRIEKLRILPSGQDVVLAARFCISQSWDFTGLFDSCGEGYLRGAPVFDARTNTIRIANVRYDVGTANPMLAALHAAAGDEIQKALERHLVFDESKEVGKLKVEVASAIAAPDWQGLTLRGRIVSFGDPKLTWTKDGFLALFIAKGTLAARLNVTPLE